MVVCKWNLHGPHTIEPELENDYNSVITIYGKRVKNMCMYIWALPFLWISEAYEKHLITTR